MDKDKFEMLVEKAFEALPEQFRSRMENVHVVVEDLPDEIDLKGVHIRNPYSLLGLYSGIPLNKRGPDYGMYPVLPDRIKLFRVNIERDSASEEETAERIKEVLIHEVAHYFGMTDREIRKAGY